MLREIICSNLGILKEFIGIFCVKNGVNVTTNLATIHGTIGGEYLDVMRAHMALATWRLCGV